VAEDKLVVELNAVNALEEAHFAQCVNYLKASDPRLGLLLNYGKPRLEARRVVNRF
jgi:GxxExxY protein